MSELIALIELGSNARFALARVTPAVGFKVLDAARIQTRLAGGRPGTLPRLAVEETLAAVHWFLERVRDGQDPRVVAVATSAVRDAASRERILDALWRNEGGDVRILTPSLGELKVEEAEGAIQVSGRLTPWIGA